MAPSLPKAITYEVGGELDLDEVIALYVASTLGERRPVEDRERMGAMIEHANLIVTARQGSALVGIARCLTDYSYVAYLSDLAVHRDYQRQGIGRELVHQVQLAIHPQATVVLLAAPSAATYYPRIGMKSHPSAWIVPANQPLR